MGRGLLFKEVHDKFEIWLNRLFSVYSVCLPAAGRYYFVTSVVSVFLQPLTTESTEIQPTKDTEEITDLSYTPNMERI